MTYSNLVAEARDGDKDAISALYEQTYGNVYYTIKFMIKDEDAVFDIVQDTYIKAFAHLESFQGDEKFLPWVKQIAANTARDWLKKKRPMLFTELWSDDGQETSVEELLPDERSENLPDQVIDRKETERLIREIIKELPEDQRAVIGMFYYEEMSVKEIATALGVSESAVKSRLMYGRNKIEKKVLELEKQGTKLYSLAPIPFLLLLFRSQKAYAAEKPDAQILRAILDSQPMDAGAPPGAAQGAGEAGAAQGAGMAGAAQSAGTAGTAIGSFGALKVGLIAAASLAVVGLGAFGVTRLASGSDESQETAAAEDGIVPDESINGAETEEESANGAEISEESAALDETEEELTPLDEALEQYRAILSQADSYDYGEYAQADQSWLELGGYRYALVQMLPNDPVPTLLLGKEIKDTELSVSNFYIRLFQYDPNTQTLLQPAEIIGDGGIRGGLSIAPDGFGVMSMEWSGGTGQGSITRITLGRDTINRDGYWRGRIDMLPDSWTLIEIAWHDIEDLSALDDWIMPDSAKAALSDSVTFPTDGDRIVLTGTVGTFNYDEIVELQGQPDPNAPFYSEDSWEFMRSTTYHVIVLDTPQALRLQYSDGVDEPSFGYGKVLLINIAGIDDMEQYDGQHITFSIDPTTTHWPSDTSPPFEQPFAIEIHILE